MRVFITAFASWLSISLVFSQEAQIAQDPAAGLVLERVAAKFKMLTSLQSNFELVIEDRKEKTKNSSVGNLMMKKNKYKLISEGNTVYFNGTTMWTYMASSNEVTVTEPKKPAGDFMSNPAEFFSFYKRDFKYRYVKETTLDGSRCHEIDLFPKNLNQPYSRIRILVNVQTDLPLMISSMGKDGVDYTVYLKNLILDREIDDTVFTFDPARYKKVEVIDMRGLE